MNETLSDEAPEELALRTARALRAGRRVADAHFDRCLPLDLRVVSGQFWTPLEVVARAAQWLTELGVDSVVDIGSGVGKFCVAAALRTHCTFIGVEHRPRLSEVARYVAELFDVEERVQFVTAAFDEVEAPAAGCYYLFNPFGENLFEPHERLREQADLNHFRYLDDVGRVEQLLEAAPVGTYVMTYNGFGGSIPGDFEQVRVDRELPCVLRMARKTAGPRTSLHRTGREWR